jgi:lipoprotein signal peptidase
MKRLRALSFSCAGLVVIVDQLSKAWAVTNLSPYATCWGL